MSCGIGIKGVDWEMGPEGNVSDDEYLREMDLRKNYFSSTLASACTMQSVDVI